MRYRHLYVENFGIHRNWRTPLATDVQLLYGPNEAGKTTLLELLRSLLFRIPPQTPYLQCSGDGPLAAQVDFELSDGRRGWFRRQKGRTDQITGELDNERSLDRQTALDALIGGVGSSLYANVFAFSADELRAGADSLREADLGEALFGGGIGGLGRFRQVEAALQRRMEDLFKPNGSRPPINAKLAEIRTAQEKFQQAQCRPQAYDEWEERRQTHAANIARLEQEMEDLRRRRTVLLGQKRALQAWSQRSEALDERRRIDVPPGMTRELAAEVRELTKAREPLKAKLEALEEQRLRRRPVAPFTPVESALLAAEEEIHALQPHLSQMAELRDELPRLRSEQHRLAKELERFRRERPGRDQYLVTREQKEAARLLAEKLPSLEERARSLKQQRERIDGRLRKQRVELESLPASRSVEQWELLAKGAAVWQARTREAVDKTARLAELQHDIDRLLRDLASLAGPEGELTQPLPFPLRTTVEAFRDRWERQDRETAEAQRRLEAAYDDLHRARQELAQCEELGPGDESDRVAERRAHRDRGWNLVRRRYCTAGSSAADAALAAEIETWTEHRPDHLLDLYEAAVAAADQAAERALERAAWETRRQHLRREVEDRAKRCAELEAKLAAVRQTSRDLHAEWEQLWSPAGIRPRSPREMLEWLEKRERVEEQRSKAAGLREELRQIESDCESFARQLTQVCPDLPRTPVEAVVQAVEKQAREVRQTEEHRSRLLEDLDQLITEEKGLQPQEQAVQKELAAWTEQLAALLQELQLPAEWRLPQLQEEMEQLQEAAQKQEQLEDLERRLGEAEQRWSGFEQEAQRVWESVVGGACRLEAVAAAEELSRRLKDARQHREQIDRAAADAAADEGVRQDTVKKLEQCDARLAELCRRLGFSSPVALESGVDRFEKAEQLDETIRQLERDLGNILRDDWESHAEELSAANEADLTARLDRLDIELDQLRKSHAAEMAEEGKLASRLRELAEETDAVARAAELEARRAELVAAVNEWAPLALTQTLFRRALKRFQEERQPELLCEVADLLQRITQGEHVAIHRSLGSDNDEHQLHVEDRHGQLRTADQLSMGTRAQLYLAIRLAFVADYCRRNEPLPVVMDDVLVHFDDDRARRTLEVLAEFSAEHAQVLLLTCHRRTVELWRELRPQAAVLDLHRPRSDEAEPDSQRPRGRRRSRKRSPPAESSPLFPPPER